MGLIDRFKHAWNAFVGLGPPDNDSIIPDYGVSYMGTSTSYRPDRLILKRGSERSIIGTIYNRIAIDCSNIDIRHVRVDIHKDNRYLETMDTYLNDCLTLSANIDQSSKSLIRDTIISMFQEGCVAVVPIDATENFTKTDSYDIGSMRVGRITQWYPKKIRVEVYNEKTGLKKELIYPKRCAAIIENPFSLIMNEPNSMLQRLNHKLALLDIIDENSSSNKLDLLIQLPYLIKTEARRRQAETRRKDIEDQLKNSKYGIAYTDGSEHVTQLNRPIENNMLKQIEFLINNVFSQMGLTNEILNGTATPEAMLNYFSRTIRPCMDAIADEFTRKFLSQTARSQGQKIMYFNNPFSLISVDKIADIADKFTRNEIMSSNEVRQIVGLKPVQDPKADELRNKNIPAPEGQENVEQQPSNDINNQETESPPISGDMKFSDLMKLNEEDSNV